MAHFQAGCKGSRQSVTRLAGKEGWPEAWVNGWRAGAELRGGNDAEGDFFDVYGTGGSGGNVERVLIGTIRVVKGKVKFTKAK